jgi:uncharacterized membrane-anchored protein
MIAPLARIIARYAAGALMTKGVIDASTAAMLGTDAEVIGIVQTVLGAAVGGITEGFYYLARRFGWSK